MRRFLACVFAFGFVVSLAGSHLVEGRPFNASTSVTGAAGGALAFLAVAVVILRPWRRRDVPAIDRPPYLAAAIVVGLVACFALIGSRPG